MRQRGLSAWAFKLGNLQPFKPILFWQFSICFIFILGAQFLLPHRANSEKREKCNSRTEWDIGVWVPGALKLDHLQPLKPFSFWQFSICFIFILGGQFLLPQKANSEKREKCNSRTEWDRGVWVPGALKLDHLQPVKPILFWQISICFIFILGGQFLLPQRANSEKR